MPSSSRADNNPTSQDGRRGLKLLTTPFRPASSSPSSTPTPPSPPPTPCPWLWRCHSCYTIYRLAVTRRCLDCDHTFCLGDAAGAGATKGGSGGKKRKRGGPCKAEFDYTGWKGRGAWRRTMVLNGNDNSSSSSLVVMMGKEGRSSSWGDEHKAATEKAGDETRFDDKREHLFLRKQHNCFLHCDFPSECHHTLFRAQQEGRPILREALALDAAAAAEVVRAKTGHARTEVQVVGKHHARRRLSATAMLATRFSEDLLPAVDEEAGEEEDIVSPCSPTSPDPPGDLMREVQQVSPIELGNGDEQQLPPVSPGGETQHRRRSLLVTTDTPADFATTAAPLCFDEEEDTYSDDDGDEEGGEEEQRRSKSRRKIAQLTGEEHAEVFGPFIFDTTTSPTSPSSSSSGGGRGGSTILISHGVPAAAQAQALDLQAAYSEQAWFSSSSSSSSHHSTTITAEGQQPPSPLSPRSPERMGKRDRMFALLGRRASGGGLSPSSPTRSARDAFNNVSGAQQHHQQQQQQQQHAVTTAEEWEGWSDSSSSSPSSGQSTASTHVSGPETDADGDVAMRDADEEDVDDDEDDEDSSTVTPLGRPRNGAGANGDEADEDLRALLRMRNAFMRGDMT